VVNKVDEIIECRAKAFSDRTKKLKVDVFDAKVSKMEFHRFKKDFFQNWILN